MSGLLYVGSAVVAGVATVFVPYVVVLRLSRRRFDRIWREDPR